MEEFMIYAPVALALLPVALKLIFKITKYDKGLLYVDEIFTACNSAKGMIADMRNMDSSINVADVSTKIASEVPGITASDITPVIEHVAMQGYGSQYGIEVSINSAGDIKVDPSNLINKGIYKSTKWLKKLF